MTRTIAITAAQRSWWYARIALGRARRAGRMSAARVGLPVRREFLVVDCADGDDASGLFSEVAAVVGCLAEVDANPGIYAGMRVDFQDHGLYYDASVGPNWWEYFFEPLGVGAPERGTRRLADWEHDTFAETVELVMPRSEAAGLVRRHVRVRRPLVEELEAFWAARIAEAYVIGVHYRGTDKWEGRAPVPYELVAAAVLDAAGARPQWKIFLATDEESCVDYFVRRFPGRVVHRDLARSSDGAPIHKMPVGGFRKGADAVLDCLALARCVHLVRTDSDLSLFATFFNPDLPVRLLGQPT